MILPRWHMYSQTWFGMQCRLLIGSGGIIYRQIMCHAVDRRSTYSFYTTLELFSMQCKFLTRL